ncbi:MAG: ribonuclease HII [Rikenellaceae bacterium]
MKKEVCLSSFLNRDLIEAGCDEAGRGSLAGPVFAAAVILPQNFYHPLLNDSKQISAREREFLRPVIEKEAISWAVASVNNLEIDSINILKASIKAMHIALDNLFVRPEFILVDGNRFYSYHEIPYSCIVKGDAKFASIAAASILAKTHRDRFMLSLAREFPQYGWEKNMAYPTRAHREAIEKYGVCKYHRVSYKLL